MTIPLIHDRHGVRFAIKVVPGASRDRVVGPLGDALKVAVSKPPEGGAANQAVVAVLAKALGLAASQIHVVRGHTNPRKEILITGVSTEVVAGKLSTFE